MTAQTPAVLKSYFETGDRPTAAQYGDLIDTACGYKSYVALLTQAGTAAPVATVLQNTLGGSVVWTRSNTGLYSGVLSNAFTTDKTFILTQGDTNSIASRYTSMVVYRYSTSQVDVISLDISDIDGMTLSDDLLTNYSVEIRVYP